MTLAEIYQKYRRGSPGFVEAVETHCGFGTSIHETIRIANNAPTPEDFERIWEQDEWWRDSEQN